jgi:hypothetical protein
MRITAYFPLTLPSPAVGRGILRAIVLARDFSHTARKGRQPGPPDSRPVFSSSAAGRAYVPLCTLTGAGAGTTDESKYRWPSLMLIVMRPFSL